MFDDILDLDMLQVAAETQPVDDAKVKSCAELADIYVGLQKQIADYEAKLKALNEEFALVAKKQLPEAIREAGMAEFTLLDGTKFVVEEEVYTSISEANRAEAHSWLRANNYGGIIKSRFEILLGKGEDERAAKLVETLTDQKVAYRRDEAVHAQTLKAFVRARLKENVELPRKVFGIYEEQVAKVVKG